MYCRNCGHQLNENAFVCTNCGVLVHPERMQQQKQKNADNGSKVGWGFLCFFFPIIGLILYLIWKDERPKTAKICGKCALASVIAEIGTVILIYIAVFVIAFIVMNIVPGATLMLPLLTV